MRNRHNDLVTLKTAEDFLNYQKRVMHEIDNNHNAYLLERIMPYIEDRKNKINSVTEDLNLTAVQQDKIYSGFLAAVTAVKFNEAYNANLFFQRDDKNQDIVDQALFDDFVNRELKIYTDQFIEKTIKAMPGYVDRRAAIVEKIKQIEEQVNAYENRNKKALIQVFNEKIEELLSQFKEKPLDEGMLFIKKEIKNLLEALQQNENTHYLRMTFFVERRRAHSSLQPKINATKSQLDELNRLCDQSVWQSERVNYRVFR